MQAQPAAARLTTSARPLFLLTPVSIPQLSNTSAVCRLILSRQGLVGISMSRDVIKFPIISASLITFYLLFGAVVNKVILPKAAIGSDVPNRTASFINATMAPGLSSFTFINEFGGPGAAGIGSLMDVRDALSPPCILTQSRPPLLVRVVCSSV